MTAGTPLLLVVSCPRWGYVVPALGALGELRANGWADAVLLHRDRAGLEQAAARWWRVQGGRTELVADAAAAVERALMVVAFVPHRDPEPMAVVERAGELGVPVWVHYQGRYPYPVGSLQHAGQHPAQLRARAEERREAERRRAAAVREARRAAGRAA